MMLLDDFVMLGTTVPEPSSDGRVFVCSAGYSPTLRQLIRVYPLARFGAPTRWSVNTVKLNRNPKDSRPESYQLAGDRRPGVHNHINRVFEAHDTIAKAQRGELLKGCVAESIRDANDRRLSLAVLKAGDVEVCFEHNAASPESPQLALFDLPGDPPSGARRFPFIPRLRFTDAAGEHRLMLRDWGVYELMRKHNNLTQMSEAERVRYVSNALHLGPSSSLLVGNFNQHRTSWLVISVLNGLRCCAPSLLDELSAAS